MRRSLYSLLLVVAFALVACGGNNGEEGIDVGLISRLFKGKAEEQPSSDAVIDLAFVLLPENQGPDPTAVVSAYEQFAVQGESMSATDVDGSSGASDVMTFDVGCEQPAFAAFVPAPVPNGEADHGAQFSLGALGTGWVLAEHHAHLVVTAPSCDSSSRVDALSRFTSFVAAVAKAHDAVGVYWGNAGATHGGEFFTTVASTPGVVPRITLWTGLSVAREADGRLSLLSLGMQQLALPDLLLVVSESSEDSALEIFFDLLAYVADRGEAIPNGETVGRTAAEKLKVKYVPSPIDRSIKVWRVEVP